MADLKTLHRALTGLAYPTVRAAIERIKRGEAVPWDERGIREVAAGTVVDDVPPESVAWLLEQGCIEPVTAGGDADG